MISNPYQALFALILTIEPIITLSQTTDEQVIRQQGRLGVAEMGKDVCVKQHVNNKNIRDMLLKKHISVGDLCGCVQHELSIILSEQLISDIAIVNYINTNDKAALDQEIVNEYENKMDSIVKEFGKVIDIASSDCFAKFANSR